MSKLLSIAWVAAVLLAVGCGGAGSHGGAGSVVNPAGAGAGSVSADLGGSSGPVVATVGDTPITRTAVNHWMATLAGGDYFELSGRQTIPIGLVSDPPNYAGCVARLEEGGANVPRARRRAQPSGVQLLKKCEQLYEALKGQATAELVRAEWLIGLDREEGVTATDAEVLRYFHQTDGQRFPNEAELREFLARKRESLGDELFLLRLDLLAQKAQKKLSAAGTQGFTEAERRWTARTTCRPGYVVTHCREYKEETSSTPSAAVLMEQVATLLTGRCTNLAACGKE